MATLNLSEHAGLTSAYALSRRKRDGLPLAAELFVLIPHGKSERAVKVELGEDQLFLLAEKALEAVRILRKAVSDEA